MTVRAAPRVLWLVVAAYLGLGLVYSLAVPLLRAPDEVGHVDLVEEMSGQWRYPRWDEREVSPGVAQAPHEVRFHEGSRDLVPAEARPRSERPSFEDLGIERGRAGPPNQLTQNPSLYYRVVGAGQWVLDALPGDPARAWDVQTWTMRASSVLMLAALPVAVWASCRRLGVDDGPALTATLAPLCIPQLFHIGSAVNNDNLANALWWLATPVVLALGAGALRGRAPLVAGALTGLAMLTKQTGLVLAVWVALAVVVGWRRSRSGWTAMARAALVSGAVAVAIGGWWWISNLVRFGTLTPSRFEELLPPGSPGTDVPGFVVEALRRYAITFWAGFGHADTQLPTELCVAFSVGALVVLVALLATPRRWSGAALGDRLLLAAPLLMLFGSTFLNALAYYRRSGYTAGVQGRYLFGAIAALAVAGALVVQRLPGLRSRRGPVVVLVVALVIHGFALERILDRYWGDDRGWVGQLRAIAAWSPLPPVPFVVVTAGAAAAVLALGAALLLRQPRSALARPDR